MSNVRALMNDDEDDTLLFERIQDYVLEHCPNPQRIGCFDHATLSTFVISPGKLDLADPNYLHVFACAECTRELMELRRIRDESAKRSSD